MSSAGEDADDERESRMQTPVAEWVDPKSKRFTVFVMLPNGEVCTLRDLPSGISVFDTKGRLEVCSGIPSQIYTLIYPDGEELEENQRLHVQENILHGYLLKMQLNDNWESLYTSVVRNNIEHVNHSGVHLRGNITVSPDETDRYEAMVRERGAVAIYMSSALGLHRMVSMLLSVGVNVNSVTPFGRTPLHAAASRDNLAVLDLLVNHGASVKQTDYFGVTAIDIAKEMASGSCAQRLRLMQLNLRGNVVTSPRGRFLRKRQQLGQSHEKRLDSYGSRDCTPEVERARSTISQYSEDSVFKYTSQTPRHKTRKSVSSSAPVRASLKKHHVDNQSEKLLQPKRAVSWKDVPKDNTHWHGRDIKTGRSGQMKDMIDVKPAKVQHRRLLKFAKTGRKTEETETETTTETNETQTSTEAAAKLTKSRLRYYKKLAENMDNLKAMRRKINISASNGRTSRDTKSAEAFAQWLEKKQAEFDNMAEDDDSGESINHSDDEEDKMFEFNKRIRKQNRQTTRSMTPGNRPIKDIIRIGSTQSGDSSNPSPYLNASAFWDWKAASMNGKSPPKKHNVLDLTTEQRRFEEKRQKLLLSAISYDEWMDHIEDKKSLIKQILHADNAELQQLENERLKDNERRERMFSYNSWKEKVKQRDIEERKRRETQRRYEKELSYEKLHLGRSTAAVQFEAWLERKRTEMQREKETTGSSPVRRGQRARPDATEIESAYEAWLQRKHNEDMEAIEKQIKKERELLGALRQMRASAITT